MESKRILVKAIEDSYWILGLQVFTESALAIFVDVLCFAKFSESRHLLLQQIAVNMIPPGYGAH